MQKKMAVFIVVAATAGLTGAAFADAKGRAAQFDQIDADKSGALTLDEMRAAAAARFAAADADGNGSLSKEEMAAQHATRVSRRAAKMLERHDTNKDGVLDAAELQAMGGKHGKRGDRRFDRMDANNDGALTLAEIEAKRDPAKLFARLDKDENGEVSADEFAKMRRGHKQAD